MFCTKCGAEIPEGADKCPVCGAEIKPQPAAQPAKKSAFAGNKLYLLLVIGMFVSAFTESWVAMILLMAVEIFFVKDQWLIRNSIQPFAVGMTLVIVSECVDILKGTAFVTYIPVVGRILRVFLTYLREAVLIVLIVFLIIGVISLFTGEVKIPIYQKLANYFKQDEEKAE